MSKKTSKAKLQLSRGGHPKKHPEIGSFFPRTFRDEKNGRALGPWVTQVQLGAPAAQVAAGAEHSCARLMDGTLAELPLGLEGWSNGWKELHGIKKLDHSPFFSDWRIDDLVFFCWKYINEF